MITKWKDETNLRKGPWERRTNKAKMLHARLFEKYLNHKNSIKTDEGKPIGLKQRIDNSGKIINIFFHHFSKWWNTNLNAYSELINWALY